MLISFTNAVHLITHLLRVQAQLRYKLPYHSTVPYFLKRGKPDLGGYEDMPPPRIFFYIYAPYIQLLSTPLLLHIGRVCLASYAIAN